VSQFAFLKVSGRQCSSPLDDAMVAVRELFPVTY